MSRRVLGQYDPVLDPRGRPRRRAPGERALPRRAEHRRDRARPLAHRHRPPPLADPPRADPRLAVRGPSRGSGEHLESVMRGLMLDALSADGETLLPSRQMVRKLPDTVRSQVQTIRHVQAVMSVLEGYSNFVMHRAGRTAIRGSDRLEAAMQQRRRQRGPIERLVLDDHRPGVEDAPVRGRRAVRRRRRRSGRAQRAEPGLGIRGDDADARRAPPSRTLAACGRPERCRQQRPPRSRIVSQPTDIG